MSSLFPKLNTSSLDIRRVLSNDDGLIPSITDSPRNGSSGAVTHQILTFEEVKEEEAWEDM